MIARLAICAAVLLWCGTLNAKEQTPQTEPFEKGRATVDSKKEVSAAARLALLQIERNIIEFTNQQRRRYGLPDLEADPKLVDSAREHTIWMTRNRVLQHTNKAVAENIAMGYPHSRAVVDGWMNSPGHRANILNGSHRSIGVAAYRTENGTIFWCQQFRR